MNLINEGNQAILHVFINEVGDVSYSKSGNLLEEDYGIFILFNNYHEEDGFFTPKIKVLNSGILLQNDFDSISNFFFDSIDCAELIFNFPPSLTHLDVSRESIISYKKIEDTNQTIVNKNKIILNNLYAQVESIFKNCISYNYSIFQYYFLLKFIARNIPSKTKINSLITYLPSTYIYIEEDKIIISASEPNAENIDRAFEIKMVSDIIRKYAYNLIEVFDELNIDKVRINEFFSSSFTYENISENEIRTFMESGVNFKYDLVLFKIFETLNTGSSRFSSYSDMFFDNPYLKNDLESLKKDFNLLLSNYNNSLNENDSLKLISLFTKFFTQISYSDVISTVVIEIEKRNREILQILLKILNGEKEFLEHHVERIYSLHI
jgi:hypothetical protein